MPHAVNKIVASEIVPGLVLCFELAFNYKLCGDAGMVGAHNPVGVEPAHAVIANQRIHQRLLERVPHVQGAGYIWRRELDTVVASLPGSGLEVAARIPVLVPAIFDRFRVKAFCEFHIGRAAGGVKPLSITAWQPVGLRRAAGCQGC